MLLRTKLKSIIASVLLILMYIVIFSFSSQDGDESGNLSFYISEKCVAFLNSLSNGNWTDTMMQGMAEYFENPIRKLAHFGEYACMGVLIFHVVSPWIKQGKKMYILITVWVFLSAAMDEIHQLFVPGRYGSFWDVLLDTYGGVFGIVVCVILNNMIKNIKLRKVSPQSHTDYMEIK